MVKKPDLLPPLIPAEARETPAEFVLACRYCGGELFADGEGGWTCPRRGRHTQENADGFKEVPALQADAVSNERVVSEREMREGQVALPAPDRVVTHIYEPDVYVGSPCKRCRLEPNHHSHAQKPLLVTDRAVTAPQEQESMPVIAAGLLTLLKEECEAQHTRAEKAESELKALRAALLVLVGEMSGVVEDLNDKAFLAHFAAKLQRLLEADAS